MGSAASVTGLSTCISSSTEAELQQPLAELGAEARSKLLAALTSSDTTSESARFGGSWIIHWDTTRGFEGKFEKEDFVAHDGDRRALSKSDIYKLGEAFQCGDRVWAYFTDEQKYMRCGKVTAAGPEKTYVELDDGDKGLLPNAWIHKMVRVGGGAARYSGTHLIHWDTTRGFEGKFEKEDFVAHDGDRRALSKSDIYKLGEAFQCGDRVWAYYTDEHKYTNSGKVTAAGPEKSYVEFDDGDKGFLPNTWIHKMVKVEAEAANAANASNA